jgi:hypothetical protein
MHRTGEVIAITSSRAVWRFGFHAQSDEAAAHGVHTSEFTWVLTNKSGKILDTYTGMACYLPDRFRKIFLAKF